MTEHASETDRDGQAPDPASSTSNADDTKPTAPPTSSAPEAAATDAADAAKTTPKLARSPTRSVQAYRKTCTSHQLTGSRACSRRNTGLDQTSPRKC